MTLLCNGPWIAFGIASGWLDLTASVSYYGASVRGQPLTHCIFTTHQTTVGLVEWS
jgi:hypothetical protein